jgi:uncharacterized protein YgiM (DUF1202 family)
MKQTLTIILLLFSEYAFGQESYFVVAPNGLNLRDSCSVNSKIIGKLPFGTILRVIEKTDITFSLMIVTK